MKKVVEFFKYNGEGLFLLFMLCFSIGMFIYSFFIKSLSIAADAAGPSFMPKMTFGAMIILTFFLCLDYVMKRTAMKKANIKEEKKEVNMAAFYRGSIAVAGIVIYTILMKPLGFMLSSMLYLFFEWYLLGPKETQKKSLVKYLVLAAVLSAIVYVTFRYVVYVKLPKGILG